MSKKASGEKLKKVAEKLASTDTKYSGYLKLLKNAQVDEKALSNLYSKLAMVLLSIVLLGILSSSIVVRFVEPNHPILLGIVLSVVISILLTFAILLVFYKVVSKKDILGQITANQLNANKTLTNAHGIRVELKGYQRSQKRGRQKPKRGKKK